MFWECYLKNLQATRETWEKLNEEGPPPEQIAVNFNLHIDHHKVLGLDRYGTDWSEGIPVRSLLSFVDSSVFMRVTGGLNRLRLINSRSIQPPLPICYQIFSFLET